MEENQRNQNLNQQSAQWPSQAEEQPTVSMQIQQLLVKQQKYQQQYNQLVDYVKKTPNLPIEQVNQIKQQLDWLNTLFVQWKQQLQALWYNQVQVNKPTEIKKWAKSNFSLKRMVIWCWIILFLIFAWFLVTLTSLIKNPNALLGIWIDASNAKIILQAFTGLLFWSFILLMIGIIIANIYRIITVKNQWKWRYVLWLFGWIFWALVSWSIIALMFSWISKIVVEIKNVEYDLVQPYLVWRVLNVWEDEFKHPYDDDTMEWTWSKYPLIAPSEMAFSLRWNELERLMRDVDTNYNIVSISLSCGDKDDTRLDLSHEADRNGWFKFQWTCLYSEKWKYTYSIYVTYDNDYLHQRKTEKFSWKTLNFESAVTIYRISTNSSSSNIKSSKLSSSNWEFVLWKAPAKVTIDNIQVFRDFWLQSYQTEWDMNWDFTGDRINQSNFDYSYNVPKVYYITYKFPELSDETWYRFPVRVEPSELPVCIISSENFQWTTKYHIVSDFIDPTDVHKISSYNYTIKNVWTNKVHEILKDQQQEINYTFPEKWTYIVVLDYVTVDGRQWWCESEPIQTKKENFDVKYTLFELNSETWKYKEMCNSQKTENKWCTEILLEEMPHTYQLQINSIQPYSNTLKKSVMLDEKFILNEDNIYTFNILGEWLYNLKIMVSDADRWIEDKEINIKFSAKRPEIVWNMTITSADTGTPISEWFEPLTVILDASKTEVNISWDEIIYFTRDFWDWEIKRNQQNWVVAHTYNYNYAKENWIFQPIVSIRTRNWVEKTIYWPVINIKKWLINVDIYSESHPSRQAQIWKDVSFSAEFDWLPEKMTWDFGDGTAPISCVWRNCTEITHIFDKTWLFPVKLTLDFDAVQQVEGMIDFKVY